MNSEQLTTESNNPESLGLDRKTIPEILRIMNENDKQVALAVERELDNIARAVELIVHSLGRGGRMFYVGAGTSGRLGVADAAECPPTFGVPPDMVAAVMAGGKEAVFRAREGCEDRADMGGRDLVRRGLRKGDVAVGLSASGGTPYVQGALKAARARGAHTVAVMCNTQGALRALADVTICPVVGPEVIMGSTRLKAGTAEKMVLNMLSTVSMIKLGRVSGNLMTDMRLSSSKLVERAVHMIMLAAEVEEPAARRALRASGNNVKQAIALAGRHPYRQASCGK